MDISGCVSERAWIASGYQSITLRIERAPVVLPVNTRTDRPLPLKQSDVGGLGASEWINVARKDH